MGNQKKIFFEITIGTFIFNSVYISTTPVFKSCC